MDKQQLLSQITDYLQTHGVTQLNRRFHCLNPAHPDRHPSMSYDAKRQRVHCFACGADYDLIDLVALEQNLSLSDAYREAARRYGAPAGGIPAKSQPAVHASSPSKEGSGMQLRQYLADCAAAADKTDYFTERGISQALIARYGLGYDETMDCVVLPCGPDSFIRRAVHEKKYLNQKGRPSPLFNLERLEQDAPVFVVEGYFDALAVETLGYAALALNGAGNAARLRTYLQARAAGQTPILPPVLLLPDRDEAGARWAEMLLSDCPGLCFAAEPLPQCKDINELLLADRAAAAAVLQRSVAGLQARRAAGLAEAEQQRLAYLEGAAGGCLPGLLAHIQDPARGRAVSTGFATLDRQLDGGLYEGLYVLGAVSSLGKTALVMQMADHMAQAGQDVLVFSLEMSRYELMARSISRESFARAGEGLRGYAKTARGILDGWRYSDYRPEERRAITEATLRYAAYADHLFLHEGGHDTGLAALREGIERHIRLTGRTPVVIVDYLQILAPSDTRYTDKQNVDKLICGLKKLSRTHGLTLLAVSSFNREHYGQQATMAAFKESGGIDYSADVLLGLQARGAGRPGFDLEAEKRRDPRELEVRILKNRTGPLGAPAPLRFYPAYSYFTDGG